jgi:hypothetical protein
MRYYAVQFCCKRAGWTTLEHLGFKKLHEAVKVLQELSSQRPYFAMRTHQMPKSWAPSPCEGDVIEVAKETMDKCHF